MEKLHIWHLLIFFVTLVSFSSQRPETLDPFKPYEPFESPTYQLQEQSFQSIVNNQNLKNHYALDALDADDLMSIIFGTTDPDLQTQKKSDIDIDSNTDPWMSSSAFNKIKKRSQHQRKRGFSMLSRWKPFNSLSKQRTSIRNINRSLITPAQRLNAAAAAANDFEMVSAETRAFSGPSGQPLRWG